MSHSGEHSNMSSSSSSSSSKASFDTLIGSSVDDAKLWLEKGECIGMPTETVYGLAGNALDPKSVLKIFAIKNRPSFDPLIVHIDSVERVLDYARDFPNDARLLAERLWPGPLTLLLPKRDLVPDEVTSGLDRVALRVPQHPLARELLRALKFPLAAPSANPFGYISPTCARHVVDQLHGLIPFVLDGGACTVGVESTIVGFEENDAVVYRLGGVAVEQLEELLRGRCNVRVQLNESSNPAAPGMLKSHYAPRKPLTLIDRGAALPQEGKYGLISVVSRSDTAAVAQVALCQGETQGADDAQLMANAAQHIFAALRTLDSRSDIDCIYAERCPSVGLGRAINDRLKRAAAK